MIYEIKIAKCLPDLVNILIQIIPVLNNNTILIIIECV